ncbi:MAG: ATP-binding cassette domain-containing protein [Prevotellaceae bacterium]|jgi:D-methionine transport system ATP-binding protein|nr:ATP-binding cassette domain-containing protein [Prevotellaceae bacterium]
MSEIIISFKNIGVTFPYKGKEIVAVNNATFDIRKGEVFGIVGTSGAGKSTLLRTINLLQKPTQGEVFVHGRNITAYKGEELRRLRTGIGMIFQQFNLINTKTVYDNIAFVMKSTGKTKEEIAKRVPEVLQLVGLQHRSQSYPAKLSGGEKQRVGIARALANNPDILLCDEPTSALDLENTNAILKLLKEINIRLGITTVIISHEMHVIKKICNRVAVMSQGEVVELDDVFAVFSRPQNAYTKQLVSHTLDLELPLRPACKESVTLKLLYSGDTANESVISDTIIRFGVKINILLGKIEYITDKPFGALIVQISGDTAQIALAEKYLRENVYRVENVIDYNI